MILKDLMRTFKDPIKDLGKYLYEISYRIFKILASRILQRFFSMWREVHHMLKFAVCMFLCWSVVLQYLDQCHGLPLLKRYQFSCWTTTTTAKEIRISFKFILHLKHLFLGGRGVLEAIISIQVLIFRRNSTLHVIQKGNKNLAEHQ